MQKIQIVPISLLAVVALSACGGGSSGGGTLALLNIGTTSTTVSPNGLPFAETGVTPNLNASQFPDDEFGADGNVVMAIRSGDGGAEPMRVDLAIVPHIASGGVPNQLGDERLTLQIDGRALQFLRSGSIASSPYTATSGDETFELSVNTLARSSTTRRITLLDGPDRVPVGIYTFGFQTNPSALPTVSAPQGRTDYVGTFRGFAIDSDMPDRVGSVDGQLTLSVVFETGEVSGLGNGHLNGRTIAFAWTQPRLSATASAGR